MGVLKDLFEIANSETGMDINLDKVFGEKSVSRISGRGSFDSIAKQAKSGVMQFPMLSSRALSFDNIQMASKAAERNFATLLNIIFSLNQVTNTSNPLQYIKRFHQNVSTDPEKLNTPMQFVFNSDLSAAERYNIEQGVRDGSVTFQEMFNLDSLNSKYIPKDVKVTVSRAVATEAAPAPKPGYNPRQHPKENLPDDIFRDNDVKKANELIPTLMQVRILREAGDQSQYIDFIVGVKAMIHPLSSEEVIQHLVGVFQERGFLFKLITWTTGEISFFKDLVFNVDQIKDEIKEVRSGTNSVWWSALKSIKAKKKLNKWTGRNPVLPNASLLISMEEVDYIKANYGFDIMEDKSARKILDELNIIQLSVLDSAAEVMYTYIDGNDHYEVNTFKHLERESGNQDKQFKEILKAVNKLQ